MSAETDLEVGAVYHVGAGCGVPHTFRPVVFRLLAVLNPADSGRFTGTAWLAGHEIKRLANGHLRNLDRDIYVITAGLRLLYSPREDHAAGTSLQTTTTSGSPR